MLAIALSMLVICASPGCSALDAIAAAAASDARYRRATAAEFDLNVVVLCSPEGELRFAPCDGQIELVLTHTVTNESGRARLSEAGLLQGALPEGDYELALGIDEMEIGLSQGAALGLVPLHEGRQSLGTLSVRFVELPPGTFEEQAIHAERIRALYDLPAVDFVHSPLRGLLLIDTRLEGPPT
jgi:hypothetical protein